MSDSKTFADIRKDGPVLSLAFKGLSYTTGSNITCCLVDTPRVVFIFVLLTNRKSSRPGTTNHFTSSGVTGRGHIGAKAGPPWMSCQCVSICGFGALLKGASAAVRRCSSPPTRTRL